MERTRAGRSNRWARNAVPGPHRRAARVGGTMILVTVLSAHLAPPRFARRGTTPGPTWSARSTAPRRAASAGIAPSLRSVTIPAGPRTTFRCVTGEPTRFPSSRLRRSPDPRCRRPPPGYVMPRACPRRLGQPRVTPSPPALPMRDRDRLCKRSSHALRRPRVAHGSCGATSAPTPHAVSLSRPRFIEPRRPSPASPAGSAPEPLA